MKALVIFESVPESTAVFLVDGLTDEDMGRLRVAHDTRINENENDDTAWLSALLYPGWFEGDDAWNYTESEQQALKDLQRLEVTRVFDNEDGDILPPRDLPAVDAMIVTGLIL